MNRCGYYKLSSIFYLQSNLIDLFATLFSKNKKLAHVPIFSLHIDQNRLKFLPIVNMFFIARHILSFIHAFAILMNCQKFMHII